MPTPLVLMLTIVFSSIGFGYFLYGRKRQRPVPFWCGIALMGYTYLMPGPVLIVAIGLALMALPYFLRS